ncbi:hypothetical protein HLY00_2660 [Mycolicibacterium hippocampi]|uniref:HTH merR-type domain-containing protein n=1 Tax=Mycolicibacterium hippocampi TaxID=659824 RepID=A0A850PXN5_9MYCO|nr:hypothetical protein [Mycolicibacterium hippocampi]
MSSPIADRNLGPAAAAREVAHVSNTTLRSWLDRGWITAVRVGPRNYLYDLDSVAAMIQPVGPLSDVERASIAEAVAKSPDPTPAQLATLRGIIHEVDA